jgi:phosphate-selective porin OprO/OprP
MIRKASVLLSALVMVALCTSAPAGENADLERRVRSLERRLSAYEGAGAAAAGTRGATGGNLFRAYWKDNLRLETAGGQFKVRIGGRLQIDWAFVDDDDEVEELFGAQEDGAEIRRSRLDVRGLVYGNIEWRTEYDFAGGDADFSNVYIGLLDVPVIGNIRVGHFEQPLSLEKINSNSYLTFMERGTLNGMLPGTANGIMLHKREFDGRLSWSGGVFRNSDSFGNAPDDESWNLSGRLTGLPWLREDGRQLVHLGVGFSHQDPGQDTLSYGSRPESHLVDTLASTGDLAVNSVDTLCLEAAAVYGPLSVQGEFAHSWVNELRGASEDDDLPDPDFQGFYVYVCYFITGEHRPYDKSDGTFTRVRPKRNFTLGDDGVGPGAWEVALRYSHLDLDDTPVDGGELGNLTAGLNWYLNPCARVMFNYVFADVEDAGDLNIFQVRFQVAF